MSSVNYTLKNKNVRLLSSQQAWVVGKNGKHKLDPNYKFIWKINASFPNMLVTASDRQNQLIKVM